MVIEVEVKRESARVVKNVEYVSFTGRECGKSSTLEQFVEYNSAPDEAKMKGQLVGKVITVEVSQIRSVFGGIPQVKGRIVKVG